MATSSKLSKRGPARGKMGRSAPTHGVRLPGPDPKSAEFAVEARRQSLAVANSPDEADDQAFIDAISDLKFE